MFNWGQETAPDEACGLWYWDKRFNGQKLYLFPNTAIRVQTSFRIHPVQLAEFIEEHDISEEMFFKTYAVWHTHPGGTKGPSTLDVDSAQLKVKYVVMTIPTREVVRYERCQ